MKIETRHACQAVCRKCGVSMVEQTGGKEESEEPSGKGKRNKKSGRLLTLTHNKKSKYNKARRKNGRK